MSTTTTLTANEVFQGDTCVAFTIPSNLKGAKAWNYAKNEVHSRWSGVISTIFATGDLLREMKNRSDDEIEGTWEKWVKANLPFSNRTDQRLRAIAAFKPFRSEEVKSVLPAYWGNLDVLRSQAMVNPNRFQELLSEEKITPSISRNEIKGFFVKKSENSGSANRNDEDAGDGADDAFGDRWIAKCTDDQLVAMMDKGTLRIYRADLQVQLDRVDALMASAATVANDAQAEAKVA